MPDVKAFGTVQAEIKVYQGISAKVFVQVRRLNLWLNR